MSNSVRTAQVMSDEFTASECSVCVLRGPNQYSNTSEGFVRKDIFRQCPNLIFQFICENSLSPHHQHRHTHTLYFILFFKFIPTHSTISFLIIPLTPQLSISLSLSLLLSHGPGCFDHSFLASLSCFPLSHPFILSSLLCCHQYRSHLRIPSLSLSVSLCLSLRSHSLCISLSVSYSLALSFC